MRKLISSKLKKHTPNINKYKRDTILSNKNYRISSLFEFLQDSQYKLYIDGKKCNSVDDIRKIIALQQFNTYEFSKSFHLSQYYNFVSKGKDLEIMTLEKWLDYFGIDSKLIEE
jgi:hypothetical protein